MSNLYLLAIHRFFIRVVRSWMFSYKDLFEDETKASNLPAKPKTLKAKANH